MKRRALFSVSDKTGVVDFAKRVSALGYEILSTGGTQLALEQGGVEVVSVSSVTGFPECLDGRLKTLHPIVHGGIMAIRDNADHMAQLELLGIDPIDIVVINLYPFKQTILREGVKLDEAIENIDIGGPTMIRSAAKNWQDVVVVVDPEDYGWVINELENGGVSREHKFTLAGKIFEHTAHYDALIAEYLRRDTGRRYPDYLTLTFEKHQEMRYGENPHQSGVFYREVGGLDGTICEAEQLHGKELSYNNIGDAASAAAVVKEFEGPCAVAVKHDNPCGVGLGSTILEAYRNAYEADPVSIYGGIVALNRSCDADTAAELAKIFLDIIIAPDFTDEALEILMKKKNTRILGLEHIALPVREESLHMRKIPGGLLVQSQDTVLVGDDLRCVTERQPTEAEKDSLMFAWKVCKHVHSNGIVLVNGGRTAGVGPGQTNRITSVELAVKFAGDKSKGSVMASDAFFPFADCVEAAAAAGVTAIIQPGGSIRDKESIDACNAHGIAMIFTGVRHFKH